MLRLFMQWQVWLLLCLKPEEQILSCGVGVIYGCPPAQFLHLLTLVPDIRACHSTLGCRESGVLVKVLQAVRELGIWNHFFVEGHSRTFYNPSLFLQAEPSFWVWSALPSPLLRDMMKNMMLILSAWSYFCWIQLCALQQSFAPLGQQWPSTLRTWSLMACYRGIQTFFNTR